jgi:hypothetical protein
MKPFAAHPDQFGIFHSERMDQGPIFQPEAPSLEPPVNPPSVTSDAFAKMTNSPSASDS